MRLMTLLILFIFSSVVNAEELSATLDRSWGLLIGDQVHLTVNLPVASEQLERQSLPQDHKRIGPWLELLRLEETHLQLVMTFQVINVPMQTRQVMTPEIELRTNDGDFLTVPALPIELGSFLPNEQGQQYQPQADATLPTQNQLELMQIELYSAVALFLLSIFVWFAWHFGLRPRHRLPFAHALFELNKRRFFGKKDADMANRVCHQAFNRTAGRVLVSSELDELWQNAPWLLPLQSDIEAFYTQSASHYFSPEGMEEVSFNSILELMKSCRAKEKMA
ncbi:MAG TPA: hypothetical protein ENH61_02955 [Methylophaga aminisulfidivorans]|nr:hypothetical protein [Methylophaga aminisulfidivorans]